MACLNHSEATSQGRRVRENNDRPLPGSAEGVLEPGQLLIINVHLMRAAATQETDQPTPSQSFNNHLISKLGTLLHLLYWDASSTNCRATWQVMRGLLQIFRWSVKQAHLNALDLKRTVEIPMHTTFPSSIDQ